MEEERHLPKNIRQIGEKEEELRVYLEDFVYTFIQKLGSSQENRAGILLGNRETVEGKRCWFINGAVELEGLIGESGVCFSEETWKTVEEEIEQYFSDCSICGWFIRGGELEFPDRDMLKKVHSQVFAGENCLMYWKEEENDCFWLEIDKNLQKLGGYYVYYERNFQMQNYMLSCRERPVSETVNDQAAQNFRKIMKSKKQKKKSPQALWTQVGTVAAAAIIFVGSIYLIGKMTSSKSSDDQVPALAVGASVERRSEEETARKSSGDVSESTDVQEQEPTLRLYMEDGTTEAGIEKSTASAQSGKQSSGKNESDSETAQQESEAATQAGEATKQSSEAAQQDSEATKQGGEAVQQNSGAEQTEEKNTGDAAQEAAASISGIDRKYTIQPGDTLAEISIRFYGSTDMIMRICETNGIGNPNTIFIGQEIELP